MERPLTPPHGQRRSLAARAGDRFVLRAGSRVGTVGGGIVADPLAARRARRWPVGRSPLERLELVLAEAGVDGVSLAQLPVRLGVAPVAIENVVARLETAPLREAGRLYASRVLQELGDRIVTEVSQFHRTHPLEPGMARQLLRSRLGAPPEFVDRVLANRTADGELEIVGAVVRVARWSPSLDAVDNANAGAVLAELRRGWHEPPSAAELTARFGPRTNDLLRFLERRGDVVQISDGRYYLAEALRELIDALRSHMEAGKAYAPADLRDMLGSSRKYLIPFLEYCDRIGITRRESEGRVWSGR